MEHPIFFISLILEKLGLPIVHDFAKAHTVLEKLLLPHITYTWFIMIILIVGAKLLVGKIELVPRGAQNFLEVVIGGIEEFMHSLSCSVTTLAWRQVCSLPPPT
jgi:F-type H+-transporting ATPase subunit a